MVVLMRHEAISRRQATGRTKANLDVMGYYLRFLFRLILLIKVRTTTSLLRRLRFLIKVLSTLNMMDTIMVRVATRMRTRVKEGNHPVKRRTFPNTVRMRLILNDAVSLLSITISTRLIRRINGNHRRVEGDARHCSINIRTVYVADFNRRFFYAIKVRLMIISVVVMNGYAKGYPLVDRLYHARRRDDVRYVRVGNMTRYAASTDVNPKTIGNAIKSRARYAGTRAIFVAFDRVSTVVIRVLFS